ncbi:hypothetical protein Tco_0210488 [Tanacetum coccineum]
MESHPKLQNPENIITLIQHEHPLQLVDLQPCYPDYQEYSDDEEEDKVIKWDFNTPCNECGKDINVYHRYFAHLDCATSRNEPFMSIFLSAGTGKTIKKFKDADHPNLLNLPFPDQTYSILQHWFSKESGSTVETHEMNLNHISHQLVPSLDLLTKINGLKLPRDSKGATSSGVSSLSCHNPMKRIELLCNGSVRPIMDVPFYKCSTEDQCCDFVLHEWCTRLAAELLNYSGHAHTLIFLPKVSKNIFGIFDCEICNLRCNGFAHGCTECQYYIDVNCGFIPDEITHEAHPNHILSRCEGSIRKPCVAEEDWYWYSRSEISFSCRFILAWYYKSQVGQASHEVDLRSGREP